MVEVEMELRISDVCLHTLQSVDVNWLATEDMPYISGNERMLNYIFEGIFHQ